MGMFFGMYLVIFLWGNCGGGVVLLIMIIIFVLVFCLGGVDLVVVIMKVCELFWE